jgi:hypothetical protein
MCNQNRAKFPWIDGTGLFVAIISLFVAAFALRERSL